ncbi:hypothetical protein [Gelidibacter maritimus]|uniref:Lipocalin-like domain-containing protein n=1 Tax=Gelidibacter maritimus TaxID=2761487 RepID=A0A7W2M3G1_9FLAO|nr:hypothetical protein [Gelidibacter maritimus]MBA6152019.1 hypothetical protein [Gelidibacter maritimus]
MKTNASIFKSILVLLTLVTVFTSTPSLAQSLEGKWYISKINSRHSTVIQFSGDSLIFYDFDQRQSATTYHIKDNRLAVEDSSIPIGGEFLFVNPNRLRLIPDRAKQPIDFVRLQPTQTCLTRAEIKQLNYEVTYQNKTLPISFNSTEDDSEKKVQLEVLDTTYFLSFYNNDHRMGAMPIKEVSTEQITVYGFPGEPFMVTGDRVTIKGDPALSGVASSSIVKLPPEDIIIGKWYYERIQGHPALSVCTKKTFFQFTDDYILHIKPYAEDHSSDKCIAGATINATFKFIADDQIKVIENGNSTIWEIQLLTKTELVVIRDGEALTLTKD